MKLLSALVGTLVGITTSVLVAWVNQKTSNHRELIREELRIRQTLYGEFITECARLLMDAFQHTLEKPDSFVPVYALINRIRLCATQSVLIEADRLVLRITEQYFFDNLSVEELHQLARSGEADVLKVFGETCRLELNSIQAQL